MALRCYITAFLRIMLSKHNRRESNPLIPFGCVFLVMRYLVLLYRDTLCHTKRGHELNFPNPLPLPVRHKLLPRKRVFLSHLPALVWRQNFAIADHLGPKLLPLVKR